MSVLIATDSAASLPEETAARLGIVVVPMTLVLGGVVYPDGELAPDELATRLHHESVTTASPSPGDILKQVEAAAGESGGVMLTVSSRMSATFDVARTAGEYLEPGRLRVIDTGSAAGGQGLVVIAAARAAARGGSVDDVVHAAEVVRSRVRLVASLGDLGQLAQSGRVPGAAAWAGRFLGLRAVFEFSDGRAHPLRPALSRTAAIDRMVAMCASGRDAGTRLHAAVLHAQDPRRATALKARLAEEVEDSEVLEAPFSSVMVAHTGPDLVGLAWWWSEPA